MPFGPEGQMDVVLKGSSLKLTSGFPLLPVQPLLCSPGENRWMKGITNEGPLQSPPLSPPLPSRCLLCHLSWRSQVMAGHRGGGLGFAWCAEVGCSRGRVPDDAPAVVLEEMRNCNMTPGLGIKAEPGLG